MMKLKTLPSLGLSTLLLLATQAAQADVTLFQDNFETGNLNQWTGKIGTPHQGAIVTDPWNPTNHVLTFTGLAAGGDIFTVQKLNVSAPRRYVLSFDFLALPAGATVPGEFGGFIGLAQAPTTDAPQNWVAGTSYAALNAPTNVATELSADGQWRRYEIDITPVILANQWTNLHLMLEDWLHPDSVPGDVFFDNIKLVGELELCIFDQLVPCDGPSPGVAWKNHGQYVSAMTKAVRACLKAGYLTKAEAGAIISKAARSECGKPKPKAPKAAKTPQAAAKK